MPAEETIRPELIRRLRSAEGHLRGIAGMVEAGADCQEILHQVRAVQGALREVNHLLIEHYLNDCLRAELWDPNPVIRARAIERVVAFYDLHRANASVSN